jgi:hypothetical protein
MNKDCNCINGFIEVQYKEIEKRMVKGKEICIENWYTGSRFCPVCEPKRAHIQDTSNTSEELGQRLRELSLYKQAENYNKQETNKTRIL